MILTITTDFSTFAGYAELAVQLISPTKGILSEQRTLWTDTSRELKVDIPIAEDSKEAKVVVFPIGPIIPKTSTPFLSKFVCRPLPHIVGVESPRFAPKTAARIDSVYREFVIDGFPFRIAEQSGETIIRHVWDAGIILSAAATCNPVSLLPDELQTFMQMTGIYGATKILEMGTGVGVLGISLAAQFPEAKVVVTDLEDAEPFVRENISINSPNFPHLRENISFRTLDWGDRRFPDWTLNETFDLIVMADVTYNTSTFVALADTLEHLLKHGATGAQVVCCGKRRHEEEEEFWRIVLGRGFLVHQRTMFTMDLNGIFRHCQDGMKKDGEQVIDFIIMNTSLTSNNWAAAKATPTIC